MEMVEPPLVARCGELRQPVTDLTLSGIRAAVDPAGIPAVKAALAQVSAVLTRGVGEIESPRYRAWHETAVETVRKMQTALDAGDGAASWRLFTDPKVGFNELGQACQGCEGW